MKDSLLALDQGTTSTRAILHDSALTPRATAQRPLAQHYPAPGWVEHEPEDIWQASLATMKEALARGGVEAGAVAGIGITNQRETVLLWDRASGRALHRAIVWQDRRTAAQCAKLAAEGAEALVAARTGLLCDPYFSATKLAWLLDNISGAREAAERGALAFGTVDSFLLWRLTGGRVHATDATNACRTMLYDIRRGAWDEELLALFRIPRAVLPRILDCAAEFGSTEPALLGAAVPIRGIAGDQHAATLGQACFAPGMVKSTYGTGCFAVLNTGDEPVVSRNRLLTTLAWQLGGKRTYALEGAIFVAGAAVQWLRDGLHLFADAAQSGVLAQQADPAQNVVFVPAFVGLGAPYWDAEARGAIFGLTRGTGPAEIARAALEAVAFQTRDLIEAMEADWSAAGTQRVLRVDGGMVASDWTMQFLADLLGAPVDRPVVQETTALGAAYLAGLQAGLLPPPGPSVAHWRLERRFAPGMPRGEADRRYAVWKDAVKRVLDAMIFDVFGVTPIINAAGTNTRLSGGMMHPAVTAAMAEAATACVDMLELQAAASREIAAATGAEAGIVTSGASAALLLGAASCMARMDIAAMDALPEASSRNEFVIARSQRNMYDRALRVAGARLEEVGIPDRFSGAGVRDASAAEIAAAITPRTAGVLWVAQPWSEPSLPDIARVAQAAGVPVLVDAAAQLPPTSNLRRFIAEGADLVCFSGGKAIGGPQASGILAGRRELVASALMQMLDLDLPDAQFRLSPEFAGNTQPPRLPHHGIGRSCKAGKEEIVGLLVALRRFVAEGDEARSARLRARLEAVCAALGDAPAEIVAGAVPLLLLRLPDAAAARGAEARLRAHRPPIHVNQGRLREGVLVVNPLALAERDLATLGAALRDVLRG